MINDPATIEFIEKLGELAKNFGALLVRYSQRLEAERQKPIDEARTKRQHAKDIAVLSVAIERESAKTN